MVDGARRANEQSPADARREGGGGGAWGREGEGETAGVCCRYKSRAGFQGPARHQQQQRQQQKRERLQPRSWLHSPPPPARLTPPLRIPPFTPRPSPLAPSIQSHITATTPRHGRRIQARRGNCAAAPDASAPPHPAQGAPRAQRLLRLDHRAGDAHFDRQPLTTTTTTTPAAEIHLADRRYRPGALVGPVAGREGGAHHAAERQPRRRRRGRPGNRRRGLLSLRRRLQPLVQDGPLQPRHQPRPRRRPLPEAAGARLGNRRIRRALVVALGPQPPYQ